jgi:hypothetical protein
MTPLCSIFLPSDDNSFLIFSIISFSKLRRLIPPLIAPVDASFSLLLKIITLLPSSLIKVNLTIPVPPDTGSTVYLTSYPSFDNSLAISATAFFL